MRAADIQVFPKGDDCSSIIDLKIKVECLHGRDKTLTRRHVIYVSLFFNIASEVKRFNTHNEYILLVLCTKYQTHL